MFINKIEPEVTATEEFTKRHRTPILCGITAVVTFTLTRNRYIKIMTDFAYDKGLESGMQVACLIDLIKFVTEKNLTEDFHEFLKTLD